MIKWDKRLSRDAQGQWCKQGTWTARQSHTAELYPHRLSRRESGTEEQMGRREHHILESEIVRSSALSEKAMPLYSKRKRILLLFYFLNITGRKK